MSLVHFYVRQVSLLRYQIEQTFILRHIKRFFFFFYYNYLDEICSLNGIKKKTELIKKTI